MIWKAVFVWGCFSDVFSGFSGFGPWAFSTRGLGLLFGNFLAWPRCKVTTSHHNPWLPDVKLWKMTWQTFLSCLEFQFFFGITFSEDEDDSPKKKMEPFPQQVGHGSETSCPTLSEASSDLFSYEFFVRLAERNGFGTGAWPTSHGSSNATGRHFRMLWCFFKVCGLPPTSFMFSLRESLFLQIWRLSF